MYDHFSNLKLLSKFLYIGQIWYQILSQKLKYLQCVSNVQPNFFCEHAWGIPTTAQKVPAQANPGILSNSSLNSNFWSFLADLRKYGYFQRPIKPPKQLFLGKL